MTGEMALAVGIIEGRHRTAEAPACSVLVTKFWPKGETNSEERKLRFQGRKIVPCQ